MLLKVQVWGDFRGFGEGSGSGASWVSSWASGFWLGIGDQGFRVEDLEFRVLQAGL